RSRIFFARSRRRSTAPRGSFAPTGTRRGSACTRSRAGTRSNPRRCIRHRPRACSCASAATSTGRAWTQKQLLLRLPAAGPDPFFQHGQPVPAPKRLAVDDEERGAEDAALDRRLAGGAGMVLDLCGFETSACLRRLEPEAACERGNGVRVARV